MKTGSLKLILVFAWVLVQTIPAMASNPMAYLSFASFTTTKGDNYFETYLTVNGNTFRFVKNTNNKYSGLAHVKVSFMQGDSTVASANYNISSPEADDSVNRPDFTNVKRYWLKKGKYTLQFSIDDPNDLTASRRVIKGSQNVSAGYPSDSVCISDAEFLSSFTPSTSQNVYTKCGYEMIPYIYTYYPPEMHKISFYTEIYNASKVTGLNEKIQVKYSIESASDKVSPAGYKGMTVLQADTVNPFMAQLNIDDLPTGSYRLVVKVVDRNNRLLTHRAYEFIRENPGVIQNKIPDSFEPYMATRDTLVENIRCLYPIANGGERFYVISDSLTFVKTAELRNFFYNFWVARDSAHPFNAWQKYIKEVMAVNHSYGIPHIMKGYKTDRGRVYLQYGPPNQMVTSDMNPTSLPYEIWQYYTLPDGQVNKRFVFYEPNLSTNNFVLLHSDAMGEVQNPQWQLILNSRMGQPNNIDQMNSPDPYGEHTLDNYANPR